MMKPSKPLFRAKGWSRAVMMRAQRLLLGEALLIFTRPGPDEAPCSRGRIIRHLVARNSWPMREPATRLIERAEQSRSWKKQEALVNNSCQGETIEATF